MNAQIQLNDEYHNSICLYKLMSVQSNIIKGTIIDK